MTVTSDMLERVGGDIYPRGLRNRLGNTGPHRQTHPSYTLSICAQACVVRVNTDRGTGVHNVTSSSRVIQVNLSSQI